MEAELRILEKEIAAIEAQITKKKNAVIDRAKLRQTLAEKLGRRQQIKDGLHAPQMLTEDTTQEALGLLLQDNSEQLFSLSPDASKTIQNLEGRYTWPCRMKFPIRTPSTKLDGGQQGNNL